MHRWIISVAVFAALAVAPVWSQHGGGGGSGVGGGHGIGGGAHISAGAGAAHASAPSGYRPSMGYARSPIGGSHPGAGNNWHGNNGWHGDGHGNGGRRFRFGYPWWNSGYAYPWWGWGGGLGWDSYDSYDPSAAGNYAVQGYPPGSYDDPGYSGGSSATYASPDETAQIQAQVSQLRAQQAARRSQPQEPLMQADTEIVYRDGHTETVSNYAITGNTLWIFDEYKAKKVPLSDIDLPATQRDNEEHGVTFTVPNTR